MVARAPGRPSRRRRSDSALMRFVHWWRAALSGAIAAGAGGARAALSRVATAVPAETVLDVRGWPVVAAGLLALVLGAAGGTLMADSGPARTAALFAGALSVAWAGMRWLILQLTAGPVAAEHPAGLRGAWALGLLAYAVALTPALRLAAWAASAAVTVVLMWRLGVARRDVTRSVALAWGAQALLVAGEWFARNAYVIAATFRR